MGDVETQIHELKYSLEDWREIVLPIRSILLWEKQWHPTALLSGSTVIFTLLWLMQPNVLTVLSLLGMFVTFCDYFIRSFSASLFKPERWTAKKDKEFEEICTNLVLFKAKTELAWASYYKLKTTNRKMYYSLTFGFLCFLTWIGSSINNLLLLYITVSTLVLSPGMVHNDMMKVWIRSVYQTLSDLLDQAKSRVGQAKKEN